ncbi:MAG: 5-formyltetrahydrofolate cyclo-ligase [Candidatus Freyarchaeota archaeon]
MESKEAVRKYVWDMMIDKGIAVFPLPPHGRIPNFKGSTAAAYNIRKLEEYHSAECVFTGPDAALKPLRRLVLMDGKNLAYATPHMKEFRLLEAGSDPNKVSIKHLLILGKPLKRRVDIAVVGSVAVDHKGNRIGKGSGYGDKEVTYLKRLNPRMLVGTLVHTCQVFKDLSHLAEPHDVPVDFILTERGIIRARRKSGV